jgi:fluoroacetyl-CoA thioesterase
MPNFVALPLSVKNPFQTGNTKTYHTRVTEDKLAVFDAGMVHPVYSTFALGKDVEWACRLFVLEMKEVGEEGVGASLSIEHLYPAPLDSEVCITATLQRVEKNKVICTWEAHANGHCIAKGEQVQRIIVKEKFDQLIASIAEKL